MPRRFLLLLACSLLAACAYQDKELHAPIPPRSQIASADFRQAAGHLVGAPFLPGNRISSHLNGDEIFPAMLSAIRSARRSITFETYVFEEGDIPQIFALALAERARAGVKVHVILDAQGARKARKYHDTLKKAGVELGLYHPLRPWDIKRYNNRTHRKLLVIDGRLGFIGGVGIGDSWAGNAQSKDHWRENHYELKGPAVAQMQAAFIDNWIKVTGKLLHGPEYFPAIPNAGSALASVFYSSPRRGRIHMELIYHLAISSARRSILIENSYFVPDSETTEALIAAARRGVRIQIVGPSPEVNDSKSVARAATRRYADLLKAGVEIYEFGSTMLHAKLMVVDGLFTSVGSANFDYRSLQLNDEANLNVYDAAFAAEQTRFFHRDREKAKRITEEIVAGRTGARVLGAVEEPVANLL